RLKRSRRRHSLRRRTVLRRRRLEGERGVHMRLSRSRLAAAAAAALVVAGAALAAGLLVSASSAAPAGPHPKLPPAPRPHASQAASGPTPSIVGAGQRTFVSG